MTATVISFDKFRADMQLKSLMLHHYFGIKVELDQQDVQKLKDLEAIIKRNDPDEDDEFSDLFMWRIRFCKELCVRYDVPHVVSEEANYVWVPSLLIPSDVSPLCSSNNLNDGDVLFALRVQAMVNARPMTTAAYLALKELNGDYFYWITSK